MFVATLVKESFRARASSKNVGRCFPRRQDLGRVRYFNGWTERKRSLIHSAKQLHDFLSPYTGSVWEFRLNLACHGAAVLEVYLILWLMGFKVSFFAALASRLSKLVNIAGTLNPGNIGPRGGNMLIVKLFGLSGGRRTDSGIHSTMRAIFWAPLVVSGCRCLSRESKPIPKIGHSPPFESDKNPGCHPHLRKRWCPGAHTGVVILPTICMTGQFRIRNSPGWRPAPFAASDSRSTKSRCFANRRCRKPTKEQRAEDARRLTETRRFPMVEWLSSSAGKVSPCLL